MLHLTTIGLVIIISAVILLLLAIIVGIKSKRKKRLKKAISIPIIGFIVFAFATLITFTINVFEFTVDSEKDTITEEHVTLNFGLRLNFIQTDYSSNHVHDFDSVDPTSVIEIRLEDDSYYIFKLSRILNETRLLVGLNNILSPTNNQKISVTINDFKIQGIVTFASMAQIEFTYIEKFVDIVEIEILKAISITFGQFMGKFFNEYVRWLETLIFERTD